MGKTRKLRKLLSAKDFAGDGEPYTEVVVTISIRILGAGITRSRLAVNSYPDPSLRRLATESLKHMKMENYGLNQDGVFGASLTENFNGWQDMYKSHPKIDENSGDQSKNRDAQAMNAYIERSIAWALDLHKKAIAEAVLNDTEPAGSGRIQ